MRDLTKKVIEAGIIPEQAVKLMRLWGVDVDQEEVRRATNESLLAMVEEIAALIEEESERPELRETDLDLHKLPETFVKHGCLSSMPSLRIPVYERAYPNVTQLIFSYDDLLGAGLDPDVLAPGSEIKVEDILYKVLGTEIRYVADTPKYLVSTVQEVRHA